MNPNRREPSQFLELARLGMANGLSLESLIIEYMDKHRVTHFELARRCNLPDDRLYVLGRYRNRGAFWPTMDVLRKLASVLGERVWQAFGFEHISTVRAKLAALEDRLWVEAACKQLGIDGERKREGDDWC